MKTKVSSRLLAHLFYLITVMHKFRNLYYLLAALPRLSKVPVLLSVYEQTNTKFRPNANNTMGDSFKFLLPVQEFEMFALALRRLCFCVFEQKPYLIWLVCIRKTMSSYHFGDEPENDNLHNRLNFDQGK